jgi:hypothetical protein
VGGFPKMSTEALSERLFQSTGEERLFTPSTESTRLRDEALAQELVQEEDRTLSVEEIISNLLKDFPVFYVKIESEDCIGIRNLIIKVYLDVMYAANAKYDEELKRFIMNQTITEEDFKRLQEKTLEIRDALDRFGYSTTKREEVADTEKQFGILKTKLEGRTQDINISNTFRCSALPYKTGE